MMIYIYAEILLVRRKRERQNDESAENLNFTPIFYFLLPKFLTTAYILTTGYIQIFLVINCKKWS